MLIGPTGSQDSATRSRWSWELLPGLPGGIFGDDPAPVPVQAHFEEQARDRVALRIVLLPSRPAKTLQAEQFCQPGSEPALPSCPCPDLSPSFHLLTAPKHTAGWDLQRSHRRPVSEQVCAGSVLSQVPGIHGGLGTRPMSTGDDILREITRVDTLSRAFGFISRTR